MAAHYKESTVITRNFGKQIPCYSSLEAYTLTARALQRGTITVTERGHPQIPNLKIKQKL